MRLLLVLLLGPLLLVAREPLALFLLVGDRPTQEVKVQWIARGSDPPYVKMKQGAEYQALMTSTGVEDIFLFEADITGLEPGQKYGFRIGEDKPTYCFRTCPEEGEIRVAIAGDLFHSLSHFRRISEIIRETQPHLIVLGGDLAYTHKRPGSSKERSWQLHRWITFFQVLTNAQGKSHELIPLAVVPGNHDVGGDQNLLLDLFQLHAGSYRVMNLPALSFFLLDTGHLSPIEGEQKVWLERELKKHEETPFKFAAYHIAAYPSVYDFTGEKPEKIRNSWVPLFEKYNLQAAFEHHNHAYKRTYPLKKDVIDRDGVTYLGDGASGVLARRPKSRDYLAAMARENSFWLIKLQKKVCSIESYDGDGKLIEKLGAKPYHSLVLENSRLTKDQKD